jgi:hypothetical protein
MVMVHKLKHDNLLLRHLLPILRLHLLQLLLNNQML